MVMLSTIVRELERTLQRKTTGYANLTIHQWPGRAGWTVIGEVGAHIRKYDITPVSISKLGGNTLVAEIYSQVVAPLIVECQKEEKAWIESQKEAE